MNKPDSDHDIWDFVITRDDFTSFWLHPNWGDNTVPSGEVRADGVKLQPPPTGRGGSGKGQVYKHFKQARTEGNLKFDKRKNEIRGPTRAKVGQTAGAPPPLPLGPPLQPALVPGPPPHCTRPERHHRECESFRKIDFCRGRGSTDGELAAETMTFAAVAA